MPTTSWTARSDATGSWTARAQPAASDTGSTVTSTTTSLANVAYDTFTDAINTGLANHTGEIGATWTRHPTFSGSSVIETDANRIRESGADNASIFYASGSFATSDYTVSATMRWLTAPVNSQFGGPCGRLVTTVDTMYVAFHNSLDPARWELRRHIDGAATILSTLTEAISTGSDYDVALRMSGTSIQCVVNGVVKITVTDSQITLAGRAGLRLGSSTIYTPNNTTGRHIDQFVVSAPVPETTTSVTTTSIWSGRALPSTTWTALP